MKRIIVFGAGNIGKELIKKIEQCKEISIAGVADNAVDVSVEGYSIIDISDKKYTDISVIIAMYQIHNVQTVYAQLKDLGYKSIFWYNGRCGISNEKFENIRLVSCSDWGECILPRVEMHVIDYCNLNCRGCTHFSPIFPQKIPDLEVRCNDIEKLKRLFTYIAAFHIMGGEPLLHPQLAQYIYKIRELLPETEIVIVSNGILIPNADSWILDSIRKNNVIVEISEYEPTYKMREKIITRLEEFNIQYHMRGSAKKQKFNKPLSLTEDSKYKQKCISDGCINIYEGKISRCPTLMYIDQFNRTFHTDLPNEGIMNLDDVQDGKKLLDSLKREVPLCKYCVENEMDWSCCGREAKISDFAVDD